MFNGFRLIGPNDVLLTADVCILHKKTQPFENILKMGMSTEYLIVFFNAHGHILGAESNHHVQCTLYTLKQEIRL